LLANTVVTAVLQGIKAAQLVFLQLVNILGPVWPRECKMRRKDPNSDVRSDLIA